jgi:hypothetical protein
VSVFGFEALALAASVSKLIIENPSEQTGYSERTVQNTHATEFLPQNTRGNSSGAGQVAFNPHQ